MTESILDSLFKLPPPEKRGVPGWFQSKFPGKNNSGGRHDNVFVYYLVLRTSFLVSFAFFALNVLSQATHTRLNFFFFIIDLTGDDFVKFFLRSYTYYTVTILLFCVIPYYLALWSNNFENMVCSNYITRGRRKVKNFPTYLFAVCLGILLLCGGMYESYGVYAQGFIVNRYGSSYTYFFLCGLTLPAILAILNVAFFIIVLSLFFDFSKSGL